MLRFAQHDIGPRYAIYFGYMTLGLCGERRERLSGGKRASSGQAAAKDAARIAAEDEALFVLGDVGESHFGDLRPDGEIRAIRSEQDLFGANRSHKLLQVPIRPCRAARIDVQVWMFFHNSDNLLGRRSIPKCHMGHRQSHVRVFFHRPRHRRNTAPHMVEHVHAVLIAKLEQGLEIRAVSSIFVNGAVYLTEAYKRRAGLEDSFHLLDGSFQKMRLEHQVGTQRLPVLLDRFHTSVVRRLELLSARSRVTSDWADYGKADSAMVRIRHERFRAARPEEFPEDLVKVRVCVNCIHTRQALAIPDLPENGLL